MTFYYTYGLMMMTHMEGEQHKINQLFKVIYGRIKSLNDRWVIWGRTPSYYKSDQQQEMGEDFCGPADFREFNYHYRL